MIHVRAASSRKDSSDRKRSTQLAVAAAQTREVAAPEDTLGPEYVGHPFDDRVQAGKRVVVADEAGQGGCLDGDIGQAGERQEIVDLGQDGIVTDPGVQAQVAQREAQTWMAFGQGPDARALVRRVDHHRHPDGLRHRPEPVGSPVAEPAFGVTEDRPNPDDPWILVPGPNLVGVRTAEVQPGDHGESVGFAGRGQDDIVAVSVPRRCNQEG